jgi:hypothetical protein
MHIITKQKEGNMKTIINTVAGFLVAGGLMAMAGSANDCDGKCMEQANTIGEMLMVAGIGAAMMAIGAMILLSNRAEG